MASIHFWWPKFAAEVKDGTAVQVSVTEASFGESLSSRMTLHAASHEAAQIIADGLNDITARLDALAQAHGRAA